jgi:hypothetical protein
LNSRPNESNGSNNNIANVNGGTKGGNKLTTDLESSLASLQNNLDINPMNKNTNKNHQWNTNAAQQGQLKTGGQNWAPPPTNTWNPAANVNIFS